MRLSKVRIYQYDQDKKLDIQISDLLWDIMEDESMTSAVLAKKSKLSKTFIREVLRKNKRLGLRQAIRLFSHLNCDIKIGMVDKP